MFSLNTVKDERPVTDVNNCVNVGHCFPGSLRQEGTRESTFCSTYRLRCTNDGLNPFLF